MRLKKMFVLILFTAFLLLSGYEFFSKLPMGTHAGTTGALFKADLEETTSPKPDPESARVDYQDILNTGDSRH